jgi:agmatine deiminase
MSSRRHWLRGAAGLGVAAGMGLGGLSGCLPGAPRETAGAADPGSPPPRDDAPAPADWQLAAEFDATAAVWLSYDAGHEALTAGLVAALRPHVALRCLVADDAARLQMQALLRRHGLPEQAVSCTVDPLASFFLRDMAVLARRPQGPAVIDFRWTQYGTAAWCAQRHGADSVTARSCAAQADLAREGLDRAIAAHLGAPVWRSSLAIEGGGFETNGRGLVIANEALYRSRNPGRSRAELDAALRRLPGVRRVLWLPEGLAEDPLLRASITPQHVAWGTGGHTDEFVRFADARTVLLAWPDDADVATHPVARLTRQRMQRNAEILAAASDTHGAPLRLLKVPTPRPIERRIFLSAHADNPWARDWSADHFAPREGRWQGQPLLQLATASYLNFVLANGVVVLPDYLPHGTPRAQQDRVQRVFEQAFPGRRVVFVDAITANWVGGGLHCATLNIPATV